MLKNGAIVSISVRRKSSPKVLWTVEREITGRETLQELHNSLFSEFPDALYIQILMDQGEDQQS